MKRADALAQLKATWAILDADLAAAVEYGRVDNTPYAQRALVRTFFAAVEGLSYQMRQVTLASLAGTGLVSEQETQLLREVRRYIDEKGREKETTAFLKFPESLLFSLSIYAKNHGATFEVNKSEAGWSALQHAAKVRNNVTHPKTPESLTLSNDDLQALMDASRWWQATLLRLFKTCGDADDDWRTKLERQN